MDRPTNILVECHELTASVILGVLEPLRPLEAEGKCCIRFRATKNIAKSDIFWCDIFVCVRGNERVTLHIVQAAKQAGRYIIYFLDDDLLHVPSNTCSGRYFTDPVFKDCIKRIIKLSDALWGVNPFLIEKYRNDEHKRCVVTRVPTTVLVKEKEQGEKIKILYAGSVDHSELVQTFIIPAIRRLCNEFGDKLEVTFIGVNPKLNEFSNVKWYSYIKDYDTYKKIALDGGFHIGLAIIDTTEFYKCKYYNKFVEYTSIGAVGVYTNSEPYTLIINNEVNGLLCNNTVEDWYKSIKRVIQDSNLRNNCLKNAIDVIKYNFKPKHVAKQLEMALPELTSYKAKYVEIKNIPINFIWWRFYWGRIASLWRVQGIKAIPAILFRIVRKLLKMILQ